MMSERDLFQPGEVFFISVGEMRFPQGILTESRAVDTPLSIWRLRHFQSGVYAKFNLAWNPPTFTNRLHLALQMRHSPSLQTLYCRQMMSERDLFQPGEVFFVFIGVMVQVNFPQGILTENPSLLFTPTSTRRGTRAADTPLSTWRLRLVQPGVEPRAADTPLPNWRLRQLQPGVESADLNKSFTPSPTDATFAVAHDAIL